MRMHNANVSILRPPSVSSLWCIEIESFCWVARLHNSKQNNCFDRVAYLRNMRSSSEMKSLQAYGFSWWQQQSFIQNHGESGKLMYTKQNIKNSALLTNRKLDSLGKDKLTALMVSCYTDLRLFFFNGWSMKQLLLIIWKKSGLDQKQKSYCFIASKERFFFIYVLSQASRF